MNTSSLFRTAIVAAGLATLAAVALQPTSVEAGGISCKTTSCAFFSGATTFVVADCNKPQQIGGNSVCLCNAGGNHINSTVCVNQIQ